MRYSHERATDTLASDNRNVGLVLRDDDAGVATLTLNRPESRNALSTAMLTVFQQHLDELANDKSVKAVVIRGNGPGFCSGHDLKEIRASKDRNAYEALFVQCSRLMMSIARLPKPVIACVHGIATAAGCQLVATCDLAFAAESARFATPGVNLGAFCTTPMVALSRAMDRKHAMEMLLSGDLFPAEKARAFGLINRVLPDHQLEDAVYSFARKIAAKSPLPFAVGKQAFYRQLEMPLEDAYDYATIVMTESFLTADAQEGIGALIEKRQPVWRGE